MKATISVFQMCVMRRCVVESAVGSDCGKVGSEVGTKAEASRWRAEKRLETICALHFPVGSDL